MKKLLFALFAVVAVSAASASELWWTVSGESVQVDGKDTTWQVAKIYADKDGYNFDGTFLGAMSLAQFQSIGEAYTDISGYTSGYSFYVELLNAATAEAEVVGRSYVSKDTPQQGSTAIDSSHVFENAFDSAGASAYAFDTFTTSNVVPEPSSALLVLLGVMALGLKRKRGIA